MKKFEFKLKTLLKLRGFKEQKIKTELGVIVSEMERLKDRRIIVKNEIGEAFGSQEKFISQSIDASVVHFFTYFIDGKRKEIEYIKLKLSEEKNKYDKKIAELRVAMGEVKVLENIKKRDRKVYKREINKELQKDIDENIMMRHNDLTSESVI